MLEILAAMIQNGSAGRTIILLHQVYAMLQVPAAAQDKDLTAHIDQILISLAGDLDEQTLTILGEHIHQIQSELPTFSNFLSANARPVAGSDTNIAADDDVLDIAPINATQEPGMAQSQELSSLSTPYEIDVPDGSGDPAASTASDRAQESAQAERRAKPRHPVEDVNNPITLARKASLGELMQIAALPNLPESLTNVLVARGDRDVLERAMRNPSASFARSSLTTLAELAPSDRMIRDCLLARHDLPEGIIERLLPFLSMESKAGILMQGAPFGEQEARSALLQATSDLVSAYRHGQLMMGLDSYISTLDEGKLGINEIIVSLARDARIAELAAFLGMRLSIRQVTAFNILSGRIDHSTAILLRALDTDVSAMDAVMTMRRRCGCREARETRSAFATAQGYTVNAARELIQRMDRIIPGDAANDTLPEAVEPDIAVAA